ncbi:MAG TPA: M23 family metallopeptidase [Pseudolysinimonas sp.]|jgi:murein DD-endopeptidase MepM/ murein hydrolase activator NlpD|nr:M23 family metallopeptidase [Pseudolysinimonas sp.]
MSDTQRRRTRSSVGSKLLSLGAMVFAGALAAGMSLPASAFGPGPSILAAVAEPADQVAPDELQTVEVSATATTTSAAREEFTALSWAQMLVLKYGTRDYRYSTDWTGPIRWPFPSPVTISSGYGERQAPCAGCSSMHMGLDFQPPNDSPIYAIADGVVAFQQDDSYGYGNHVILDHGNLVGDGHDIQTLYAHMQHGSVPVRTGDTVQVGDFLGLVGRTGTATGIHLHFEVHVDGTQVDPFKWLKAYAS